MRLKVERKEQELLLSKAKQELEVVELKKKLEDTKKEMQLMEITGLEGNQLQVALTSDILKEM